MMYKPIMKFIFIFGIPVSSAILSLEQLNNSTFLEFPTHINSYQCKDDIIVFNFFNTYITDIGPDFINNPLVTCLNLSNNSIKNIAKDGFKSLPNLIHLFLSNNNIYSSNGIYNFGTHQKLNVLVLNNMMNKKNGQIIGKFGNYPNLEILSARNNNFKELESEITLSDSYASQISFPKLKFLDLSENSIGYFTDRDHFRLSERSNRIEFMNLLSNTLQFLDLHDNMLHFLILRERGSNLLVLNVNNNYFRNVMYASINYAIFYESLDLAYLNNLQYLSISENKIEAISLNAFQDSSKLTYLNLSKNYINYLHPDTFANLHFLQVLDLSSNQINYVPSISNQININVLDLSCNQIKNIISNGFIQTPKLTKLLLEGNQIDQIDAKAFAHLFALEELNLSNNKLNSLPEEWTESLTSLKYLNLSNNTFISLESLSLKSALSLTEVYLVMNPLEYTNIRYAENLPQSLTVYLTQKSNFSCKCIA